jgi:hypothetical protein
MRKQISKGAAERNGEKEPSERTSQGDKKRFREELANEARARCA